MKKTLKSLTDYIESSIKDYEGTLAKWYRESAHYKKPTLKDVFDDQIAGEIEWLLVTLEADRDISRFLDSFDSLARSYGASWFDEDLSMVRTGNEYETQVCTDIRNIVAEALGKPVADWHDFWQGHEYHVERSCYE